MTIRDPGRLVDVVVVVPARNEAARIATCLRSVRNSLHCAVSAGAVGQVAVAVVGHHCTDDTLDRADRALFGLPHVLLPDSTSITVGDVRALGVRAVLDLIRSPAPGQRGSRHGAAAPRDVWILNTDADSVVPTTWVTDVLTSASGGQQAVIGMAQLPGSADLDPAGRARNRAAATAYRRIIRAGIHGRSHDHVYGANLAVRADAYAAVGGFPSVPVGEDNALLQALVNAARPVVRPRNVVVTTSDRRRGRAAGGLASLLERLDRGHGSTSRAGSQA